MHVLLFCSDCWTWSHNTIDGLEAKTQVVDLELDNCWTSGQNTAAGLLSQIHTLDFNLKQNRWRHDVGLLPKSVALAFVFYMSKTPCLY